MNKTKLQNEMTKMLSNTVFDLASNVPGSLTVNQLVDEFVTKIDELKSFPYKKGDKVLIAKVTPTAIEYITEEVTIINLHDKVLVTKNFIQFNTTTLRSKFKTDAGQTYVHQIYGHPMSDVPSEVYDRLLQLKQLMKMREDAIKIISQLETKRILAEAEIDFCEKIIKERQLSEF